MMFPWNRSTEKNNNGKTKKLRSFAPVIPTTRIAEYRGELRNVPGAEYHLLSESLDGFRQRTFIDLSRSQTEAHTPTHVIVCCFTLPKEPDSQRVLFDLLFDCHKYNSLEATMILFYVTDALSKSLTNQSSRSFLIRCKNLQEYPGCVTDEEVDQYWHTEGWIQYKRFSSFVQNT